MARTEYREALTDGILLVQLVDDRRPQRALCSKIGRVTKDVKTVFCSRECDIGSIDGLRDKRRVSAIDLRDTMTRTLRNPMLDLVASPSSPELRTSERMMMSASSPWKLSTVRSRIYPDDVSRFLWRQRKPATDPLGHLHSLDVGRMTWRRFSLRLVILSCLLGQ